MPVLRANFVSHSAIKERDIWEQTQPKQPAGESQIQTFQWLKVNKMSSHSNVLNINCKTLCCKANTFTEYA